MTPRRCTVHCSDSPNGREVSVAEITRWHVARGFRTIGYHFVIQPSGRVDQGREITELGAHVEGFNKDNVGICLIGKTQFSKAQFQAVRELLASLAMQYGIPAHEIYTHNYFNPKKTCPNMPLNRLIAWYAGGHPEAVEPYVLPSS